jgi:hypothetical protein
MRLTRLVTLSPLVLMLGCATVRGDDFSSLSVTKVEKIGTTWTVSLSATLTTTDNPLPPWDIQVENSVQMPLSWDSISWTAVPGQLGTYTMTTTVVIEEAGTYYFRLIKTPPRAAIQFGDVVGPEYIGP